MDHHASTERLPRLDRQWRRKRCARGSCSLAGAQRAFAHAEFHKFHKSMRARICIARLISTARSIRSQAQPRFGREKHSALPSRKSSASFSHPASFKETLRGRHER
jgi:hypothetical protein